ncbi:MAG: ArsA-related P-loop ATPase [Acidimicrobiales bacterium]
MEEQLSGQCTVEVAAFDRFSLLLGSPDATEAFDRIIFDTAPTGHTLRLLSLPAAWSTYLETTPAAASCLGPLGSLEGKRDLYEDTVTVLRDPHQTTVVLVSRADRTSLREAARAAAELAGLGVANQRLVISNEPSSSTRHPAVTPSCCSTAPAPTTATSCATPPRSPVGSPPRSCASRTAPTPACCS